MNLKNYRSKLVGSKDERAVSPVIGVILMVAITVILAAVIAAFVLDLGGSVSEEAQAGVDLDVDESGDGEISVEVTSLGNADHVELGGDINDGEDESPQGGGDDVEDQELGVGDSITLDAQGNGLDGEDGTLTAIAVIEEDDTTTQVGSADWEGFATS